MMSGARAVNHASRVHPERNQKTVGEDANRDSLCFLVDVETCSVRPSEQSRRCCKSRVKLQSHAFRLAGSTSE